MILLHLFPIAVCIVGFVGLLMRLHGSESDAERQRDDNEHLRSINTGLRYDLMATRSLLDGAVEAKALLRRQSRARLREARRWRDRAMVRDASRAHAEGRAVQVLAIVAPWSTTHGTEYTAGEARRLGLEVTVQRFGEG